VWMLEQEIRNPEQARGAVALREHSSEVYHAGGVRDRRAVTAEV
jgi:hypothetical protein